jgi:nitrous oxidase accessory protein NosD
MKRLNVNIVIAASLLLLAAWVTLSGLGANTRLPAATEDFVVASPRDAGPGTLRDAILAADRLTTRARIVVTAKRITIESALPALINPRGIEIEAAAGAGVIDAARQKSGAVLQIDSPASVLRGLAVVDGHTSGIIVNASGAQLESLTVKGSKIGILLTAAAAGSTLRTCMFDHDDTAVMAEAGARGIGIFSTIFRDNSRAGFWSVAAVASSVAAADGRYPVHIVDAVFERNAAGVVLANQPTLVQKSRFIANRDSAVLVLSGALRVEDSEIRSSGGAAISVAAGGSVVLMHNTLIDNVSTAISVRDSDVVIEHNTLTHNGFGIVSVVSRGSIAPVIADNVITQTSADGITLIGGAALLQRNQITGSRGAGLRTLDLVQPGAQLKVAPRLEANVIEHNGIDVPPPGVYRLPGAL